MIQSKPLFHRLNTSVSKNTQQDISALMIPTDSILKENTVNKQGIGKEDQELDSKFILYDSRISDNNMPDTIILEESKFEQKKIINNNRANL